MTAFLMKLLNMSLTATVVLAVILLLRALLKNRIPRWGISLLWLVAALALVVPFRPASRFSIWKTTDLLLSVSSVISDVQTTEQEIDLRHSEETFTVDDPSVLSAPVGTGEPLKIPADYIIHEIPWQEPAQENSYHDIPAAEYPLAAQPHTASRVEWLYLFFRLWSTGVSVMAIYALVRYAQIKRRVAVSVPFVDGAYLCDAIDTPFVLGFFQPKIYLPSSLADGDFVPVIMHERAHIAHGDHIIKAIGWWILTAHWFNPLVWVCYHCFCSDLEFACDERAVKHLGIDERRSYAEALLSCSIGAKRSLALSHPLAFGEIKVRERISAVLHHKPAAWYQVTAVLLLCVVLGGCFLTEPMPLSQFTDILEQNGYSVRKAEIYQRLEITVDADMVSGFAKTGATVLYDPGDVVVYDCAPTMLSLTKLMPTNDKHGDDYWMNFTFTYSDPPTEGIITTLLRPEYEDGNVTTWSSIPSLVGDVRDASGTYTDCAECLYQEQGVTFGIRIDREVLVNAKDYLTFTVGGFSDVYYSRGDGNHADDILITKGGVVGPDCIEMYVNNYDNQPIDLTLALEAFPDASLASDAMNIYMVEDDKQHWILSGMPVRNIYLSDLTGDGKPEFCATVYWGSGMVDSHIVVYDYVEKREYTLWDRGMFDYRLEMENNTLYAVMTDYETGEELYRDVLMLIPTGDDCVLSMGKPDPNSILFDLYENGETYVPERCIYMTPLSSTLSIGGDTGYRYLIDPEQHSFCQINHDTGSIQTVGSLLGGWRAFPWTDAEFAAMFLLAGEDTLPLLLDTYTERKVLPLTSDRYLLSMNDELWLMQLSTQRDGTDMVWSIHELVPEADKGYTYYRYAPMMSSMLPQLPITFDLPGITEISAFCGETALASVPADGGSPVWSQSWANTDGSMQVLWRPTAEEPGIPVGVDRASITFTAMNEDQLRYCAGTIYITRYEEASDAGDDWYRVTVVGQGLTVTNDGSGFGALISWDGN